MINFKEEELGYLIDVIVEENIVENKKSDSATWRMKEQGTELRRSLMPSLAGSSGKQGGTVNLGCSF